MSNDPRSEVIVALEAHEDVPVADVFYGGQQVADVRTSNGECWVTFHSLTQPTGTASEAAGLRGYAATSGSGTMARDIHYFAYGTLQQGLSNYADVGDVLGEPRGRFRTLDPFAVVVPHEPGCANPGCNLLHRMAMLVPQVGSLRVEGDVYLVDADGLCVIDRLENYDGEHGTGPYVRREIDVVSIDGLTQVRAQAYRVRDPAAWRALVELGRADAVACYTADMATSTPKDCCVRAPGHTGAHDTIDPLSV